MKMAGVMVMQSINKKAFFRIYGHGSGWAFSLNDFVDGFSSELPQCPLSGQVELAVLSAKVLP